MRGAVSFEADGRSYNCAFTTSAMVAYEEKYDEPFLALVTKFDGEGITSLRFAFLFALFAIALRACHKDMDDDEVAAIADAIAPKQIITLIGDAIRAAFPDDEALARPADGENARGKKKPMTSTKK